MMERSTEVRTYYTVPGTGGYYNELEHFDTYEEALELAREQAGYADVDEYVYVEEHKVRVVAGLVGKRPLPTQEELDQWARERAEKIARGENPDALTLPSFSVQRGGITFGGLGDRP